MAFNVSVQVKELQNPDTVFETILGLVIRLAEHGLIHCDFNEFNIMVCDEFPLKYILYGDLKFFFVFLLFL